MKYDMCGGAAVMAAMRAVAELKPAGINVVGIIPATENMPAPQAMPRPTVAKRNIMSRGSRTTVRKRMSDRAPSTPMPRDSRK